MCIRDSIITLACCRQYSFLVEEFRIEFGGNGVTPVSYTHLAPDSWFSHLAIEVPGEHNSTEWLETVGDDEYSKLK